MIRLFALGLLACLPAAAQEAGDPLGSWQREDGGSKIEISRCGEDLCAVNVWVRDADGDEKLGDVLVMSVQPAGPGKFEGQAHDRRRDKTYAMTLSVNEAGLQTEGCVLFGILCRSASWTRAQ